jgi:cyclic-di-GMP-binding protein
MASDINSIPIRKTSTGEQIETRPLYVEEWLDKLPYIDFQKTGQLLYEATRATNKETIKPPVRLELVELYNRPYQYYLDSQINTGAQHTLQSISSMQAQLDILKKIAVNLGLACKLAVDELLRRKTLWGQTKPPLPSMLMSLNYLSHAMIFSFLEYAPIPKNVWREVNFIYTFAQDLGQENNTLILPGKDVKTGASSIAHAYKKIVLASLADPHHLPFGAIWEIFEQLQVWAEFAQIKHFETPPTPSGYFVINLDKDAPPLPFSKFNTKLASEKHRLIDTTKLGKVVQLQLETLNNGKSLDKSVKISPYFAKSIMAHMSKAWGLPPKRYFPRETCQGSMKLACGLDSAYYFLNKEEDFIAPQVASADADADDFSDYLDDTDSRLQKNYSVDEWGLVDQGPGGFAVMKNDKPQNTVRVGDLVGIDDNSAVAPTGKWNLGIIRWLMIRQNKVYKVGIQMIGKQAYPAAIRACDGDQHDLQYRRAFLMVDPARKSDKSVIANKGLFMDERKLEIHYNNKSFPVRARALEESSVSFEQFSINQIST